MTFERAALSSTLIDATSKKRQMSPFRDVSPKWAQSPEAVTGANWLSPRRAVQSTAYSDEIIGIRNPKLYQAQNGDQGTS